MPDADPIMRSRARTESNLSSRPSHTSVLLPPTSISEQSVNFVVGCAHIRNFSWETTHKITISIERRDVERFDRISSSGREVCLGMWSSSMAQSRTISTDPPLATDYWWAANLNYSSDPINPLTALDGQPQLT